MKCSDIPDVLVLDLASVWQQRGCVVDELVALGVPVRLAFAKVDRHVRRGMLDYGTSPRCPWLTDAGQLELDALVEAGAPRDLKVVRP